MGQKVKHILLICFFIIAIKAESSNPDFKFPGLYTNLSDSAKIEFLIISSKENFETNKLLSETLLLKALEIAQLSDNNDKIIELYYSIGVINDNLGRLNLAQDYYEKAWTLANSKRSLLYVSLIANNLGNVYQRNNRFQNALELYYTALKFNNNEVAQYINIGNVYSEWGDYNKAEEYYRKAFQNAVSDTSIEASTALMSIGYVMLNRSKFDSATVFLNQSLRLAQQYSQLSNELRCRYYLAILCDSMKRYDDALSQLSKLANEMLVTTDKELSVNVQLSLGDIYSRLGATDLSLIQFHKALYVAEQMGFSSLKRDLLYRISILYEKKKNFEEALSYRKKFDAAQDSIFNFEKYRELSGLMVKFETAQKERENIELQARLEFNKKLVWIVSVFLLITFVLLFIQLFQQNRIEKLNILLSNQVELTQNKSIELESANTRLNRLMSVIGHDLRGQIGTIVVFFEYLEITGFSFSDGDQLKMANGAQHDAQNVLDILENLLMWGKSKNGKMVAPDSTFYVKPIIDKTAEYITSRAKQKNVEIVVENGYDGECSGDEAMIFTVLRNLVSNALKFTPEGGRIEIKTKWIENLVWFSVKDSGIGMPEDVVEKIFHKNEAHTTQGTNNEKGTGLGLRVCIDFLVMNSSQLQVKSALGEGTDLYFSLLC